MSREPTDAEVAGIRFRAIIRAEDIAEETGELPDYSATLKEERLAFAARVRHEEEQERRAALRKERRARWDWATSQLLAQGRAPTDAAIAEILTDVANETGKGRTVSDRALRQWRQEGDIP